MHYKLPPIDFGMTGVEDSSGDVPMTPSFTLATTR